MYNAQPPFRPPGHLPPFPPQFTPNGQPSGVFPPFPPPQGFTPPPFPPNFPPGSQPPQQHVPSPMGARPPPGLNMYPPRPSHPGLGLPPLPTGMPVPPRFPGNPSTVPATTPSPKPNFVKEVKTTSVFVGGIAPGVTDNALKDLLNACGPLHELKRVVGATGKPQAFGFALFENPEVVMRCIRCLNGVELPDLSPEGRAQRRPAKPLVVKVDEKTQEFLDEFERTLGRSDDDEVADAICRKAIAHLVARLTDPTASLPDEPKQAGRRSPLQVIVPAHLQDLKEGDLPESQRVVVLDQIAIFREAAMRNDRDKKRIEEERERFKQAQSSGQMGPGSLDYGYGNRALTKNMPRESRQWVSTNQPLPQNGHAQPASQSRDPQAYSDPVTFVRAQASENREESERSDEEAEQLRQQRHDREKDAALRERERRVETHERQRLDDLNRELNHRKQQSDLEERARIHLSQLLANWDDDEKIERGREWFHADRARWRTHRQLIRTREYQDDVRDRQAEQDELKALEQESEDFLRKQLAELAELEENQRKAGLLTEDAVPIKLALAAVAGSEMKEEKRDVGSSTRVRPIVNFENEEDEGAVKRSRTLVKLEYEGEDGLTETERVVKRNLKLLDIRKQVPQEKKRLWSYPIAWAAVNQTLLRDKITPFVQSQMKEYLGEVDEDLVDFVIEQIRAKKPPDDLVDGLEPVLADEASAFTTQVWRLLAFESLAFTAGIETGTMLV